VGLDLKTEWIYHKYKDIMIYLTIIYNDYNGDSESFNFQTKVEAFFKDVDLM